MRMTESLSALWSSTFHDPGRRREGMLDRPGAAAVLECALRLGGGLLLAAGRLPPGCAPFGLGFLAASGAGPAGLCALAGCAAGYLSGMGLVSGLRYVSAAILIYALSFAFYDLRIYQTAWFLPLGAALMGAVTGVVYLAEGGLSARWELAGELILIALTAWGWRTALSPLETPGKRPGGWIPALLLSGGSAAASLAEITLLGGLQAGFFLSAVAVLLFSQGWGLEGVAAGVVLGLALDGAAGSGGTYTGVLALGGLLAALARQRGRLAAALLFLLGGTAALLLNGTDLELSRRVLAAHLAGAALTVCLLPERFLGGRARDRPHQEERGQVLPLQECPTYTKQQLQARLANQAQAYETLYEDMRQGLSQSLLRSERLEQVFDRAAERVCQGCGRYHLCWKQEYHETYQAFQRLLTATRERGCGQLSDLPVAFLSRCGRAGELVSAANGEYTALLCRRQMEARLYTSRQAVWRQYAQLARLLGQAAQDLESDLVPDPEQALPVLRFLRRHGLRADLRLGRDRRGRLVLQLFGGDLSPIREGRLLEDLSKNMGVAFAVGPLERDRMGHRLTLVQEDNYQATAGVAALSREGQAVSGDGGSWFRDRDGTLWVVLCDGMGSGPEAREQSRLALRLLEDFLKAGVGAEIALATLSNALALRGEERLGFTTIDLLGVDLFSGQCRSYKLGAAPTYLRQKGRVKKLTGASLPAGLELGQESRPDVKGFYLSREDMAVLVSDGVSDGEEDDWLWQLIRAYRKESPKELAAEILAASPGGRDDRTVIVLQLRDREAKHLPRRGKRAG